MKNVNAEIFKKNKKRNNLLLIGSIILLIITGLLMYLGIENENKKLPTPVSLNSLIKEEKKDVNVYSYIDANTKPYLFAVYEEDGIEEDNKYYLIMDKDNHLYIVYMNTNLFNELNVDNIKDNPIKVLGITKIISNDIKDLAIDSYNELMNDEYLTKDNFKEYVGFIYLDTVTKVNDSELYYLGALLTGFFFLLTIIIYIVIVIKNKKTFNSISDLEIANIDAELQEMENSEYSKMNFFLLKDKIIDLYNNIVIIKYEDILWAYPFEQRYNGLLINKYIKVIDKKNKTYQVANTKLLDKNKDEILEDILNKLKEKNNDIIIGFNKENRLIVKEKVKELKNK